MPSIWANFNQVFEVFWGLFCLPLITKECTGDEVDQMQILCAEYIPTNSTKPTPFNQKSETKITLQQEVFSMNLKILNSMIPK